MAQAPSESGRCHDSVPRPVRRLPSIFIECSTSLSSVSADGRLNSLHCIRVSPQPSNLHLNLTYNEKDKAYVLPTSEIELVQPSTPRLLGSELFGDFWSMIMSNGKFRSVLVQQDIDENTGTQPSNLEGGLFSMSKGISHAIATDPLSIDTTKQAWIICPLAQAQYLSPSLIRSLDDTKSNIRVVILLPSPAGPIWIFLLVAARLQMLLTERLILFRVVPPRVTSNCRTMISGLLRIECLKNPRGLASSGAQVCLETVCFRPSSMHFPLVWIYFYLKLNIQIPDCIVVAVSSIFSPLSLLIASLILFLWRPILLELGSAVRLNGGNYSYLLQVSGTTLGLVGAAVTLLDSVATSTEAAATAASYLRGEFTSSLATSDATITIALLTGLSILCLFNVRTSSALALSFFSIHVCI